MDPLTIGALVGAGSSLIGGLTNLFGQKSANEQNIKIAREQMQWNENMWKKQNEYNLPSNQIARMQEAGLHPGLMYSQGNVGNAGEVKGYSAPTMQNIAQGFGNAIQDAGSQVYDYFIKNEQLEQMKAQTSLLKAKAEKEKTTTPIRSQWVDWFSKRNQSLGEQARYWQGRANISLAEGTYADKYFYNRSELQEQYFLQQAAKEAFYEANASVENQLNQNKADYYLQLFYNTLARTTTIEELRPDQLQEIAKRVQLLAQEIETEKWKRRSGLNAASFVSGVFGIIKSILH